MAQRFRLQSVLEMRERQEELRQQELAALLHQQRMAEEALGLLERQLAEQQRALAARGRGLLDVPAVRYSLAFIEGKRQAIAAQHAWAAELEAGIVEQRERLLVASRDKRVLEQLRDRQAAAERVEADRRDQRAADELVTQRFARQAWEV